MKKFHIKFDGGEADEHHLPMRQLGAALLGIDNIVNHGLFLIAYGHAPKRKRFELHLTADEPKKGSYDIVAYLKESQWVLPLARDFIVAGGVEISKQLLSFVLMQLGGRPKEAEIYLQALLKLNKDHLDARNQNDEHWRQSFLSLAALLAPQARHVVAPVGNGATKLSLIDDASPTATIDEPIADVIRSKRDDEVGDLMSMSLEVDGIIHHNRQLKVADPSGNGRYITAEIRDPLFSQIPNPYADAAAHKSNIRVLAKPVFREGELLRLYVMDIDTRQ